MKTPAHTSAQQIIILLASAASLFSCTTRDAPRISRHDSGEWGSYELWEPSGQARGLVFFFSAKGGFQPADKDAAEALTRLGAAVALVNTDFYLARIDQSPNADECLYLPGAVEWASHYLQQRLGLPQYRKPFLLGRAAGAGIVYALLVQGSAESFAGGLSVDFSPLIALKHPLCDHLPVSRPDSGQVLDSTSRLCGWWHVGATEQPAPDAVEFVRAACAANKCATSEITVPETFSELVIAAFGPAIKHAASSQSTALAAAVVEVSGTSTNKTLAVIYSGDGGWRGIDQVLGNYLAHSDVAVVGVNCLSYFWKKRSADDVSRDLAWLLRRYLTHWGMHKVVLIGYSFGADILPPAYNRLPPELKEKVVQLSLLAPSRAADFEFHFSGWLSSGPSAEAVPLKPEIKRIDKKVLQCFYGADEASESLCADPEMQGAEIIETSGSHHFDGNYNALGDRILCGALRRSAGMADNPYVMPGTAVRQ